MPRSVWLRLEHAVRVGEYELDAVTIEWSEVDVEFDFRFELGSGLSIFWALPIAPGGRLRCFHVDGAAYELEEPILVADPWSEDVARLEWRGELAELGDGRTLVSVAVEASAVPPSYRCELGLRAPDGTISSRTLARSD